MIRLEMKNGNTILMKNHKNSVFSLGNIVKYNMYQVKEYYPLIKVEWKVYLISFKKSFKKANKKLKAKRKKIFKALKVLKPTEQKLKTKDAIPEN